MTFSIPFIDFGGEGEPLHIAHGNSYHPGVYAGMAERLAAHYKVTAILQRPYWAGSLPADAPNMLPLAQDLLIFFGQQGLRNVIGVGHSLGGVVTFLAALKRPDLFRALVFIDPVFLAPDVVAAVSQNPDLMKDTRLYKGALKRRQNWGSKEAAFAHYRGKSFFAPWSDEMLRQYVETGLRLTENGDFTLAYPAAWEAHIYASVATDVWSMLPQLKLPTLAIRAEHSDALLMPAWELWQQLQPAASFVEIAEVEHMVPVTHPDLMAERILSFLAAI